MNPAKLEVRRISEDWFKGWIEGERAVFFAHSLEALTLKYWKHRLCLAASKRAKLYIIRPGRVAEKLRRLETQIG